MSVSSASPSTLDDFEAAVAFYRDALGMPVELHVESEGGAEVSPPADEDAVGLPELAARDARGIQLTLFEELGG